MNPAAIGLILATLAGLATTLGGAVVFFLKDYSVQPFAICMSASASVMIYASFLEMLPASISNLTEGLLRKGYTESDADKWAYLWATITFLLGWIFTTLFDKLVHGILHNCAGLQTVGLNSLQSEQDIKKNDPENEHMEFDESQDREVQSNPKQQQVTQCCHCGMNTPYGYVDVASKEPILTAEYVASKSENDNDDSNYYIPSYHEEDITTAHIDQATIEPHQNQQIDILSTNHHAQQHDIATTDSSKDSGNEATKNKGRELLRKILLRSQTTESDRIAIAMAEENFKRQHTSFSRLGLVTGLALFLHNFPEGLATFSASLADASLGFGIAVAVAIHNIPEGFAVAVPIYFGTGSKWKGFWYSFLSGIAEPFGALVAYFIIGDSTDPMVFGVLFAIIAGIMCNISFNGLYPTAIRYDPTNRVVTLSYFVAMAVMASSLIGFKFLE